MPRPNHGAMGLAFLACRVLQFACLVIVMGMTARFVDSIVNESQQPPQPLIGILSVVCFAIMYIIITMILYWDRQLPLLITAAFDGLFFIALMVTSIIIGKPLSYISCKGVGHSANQMVSSVANNLNQWAPAATSTSSWAPAATTSTAAAFVAETAPTAAPTPTTATVNYITTTVGNAAATVAATLAPGESTQVQGSDGKMYTVSGSMLARRGDVTDAVMKVIDYESWIRAGPENSCVMMKAVWGFGIALTILFVFSAACVAFVWRQERHGGAKKIEEAEA